MKRLLFNTLTGAPLFPIMFPIVLTILSMCGTKNYFITDTKDVAISFCLMVFVNYIAVKRDQCRFNYNQNDRTE